MIPKVNKDFLVNDEGQVDVEIVTYHGHVAESMERKVIGKRYRKKVTNSRLKEYMT